MRKHSNFTCFIRIIFTGLLFFNTIAAFSQENYNSNSVRPIRNSDIMYKKRVVRALDLREKQNKPLMAVNNEITALLLDVVRKKLVQPYTNDSLTRTLTLEEFNERLVMPSEMSNYNLDNPEDTTTLYLTYGPDWRNELPQQSYYLPKDLYQMEITEDFIFDKNRSRTIYDIQSITIYIPADHPANLKGIQLPIASFRYKDLVEKVFKNNSRAMRINPQNDQANMNLADAFELRLFSSYIIKVSNPEDAYLADKYNDQKKGILASQWAAMELLEYEHNLWEF